MTILGILLTILKIIGIVLLVLLLLILTVILLLLFVPFRYRVHADKVGWDLNAGGNVSWLLHMISVDIGYGIRESGYGGGLTKDIRIFGISIFKVKDWLSGRRKKKSKEISPSGAEHTSEESGSVSRNENADEAAQSPAPSVEGTGGETELPREESTPEAEVPAGDEAGSGVENAPHTVSGSASAEAPDTGPGSDFGESSAEESGNIYDESVNAAEPEGRSPAGMISGILRRVSGLIMSLPGRIYEILVTIFMKVLELFAMLCGIPGRIVALCGLVVDKILTIYGKITLITDFFFDDRTQDAIHFLLGKTGNLLGHVRPRKLSGYLDFGFDDPSITGRVLGVLSVFLPQVGKTFDINPDFEKSHLECDVTSSGRVYLFYLIYIAASTYFNKNIKYVIRYVRHLRKELSQA